MNSHQYEQFQFNTVFTPYTGLNPVFFPYLHIPYQLKISLAPIIYNIFTCVTSFSYALSFLFVPSYYQPILISSTYSGPDFLLQTRPYSGVDALLTPLSNSHILQQKTTTTLLQTRTSSFFLYLGQNPVPQNPPTWPFPYHAQALTRHGATLLSTCSPPHFQESFLPATSCHPCRHPSCSASPSDFWNEFFRKERRNFYKCISSIYGLSKL